MTLCLKRETPGKEREEKRKVAGCERLRKKWFAIAFILWNTSMASAAQGQNFTGKAAEETAGSGYGASVPLTGDDIIEKMLERNRVRSLHLERYSSVRTLRGPEPSGEIGCTDVGTRGL